MKQKFILLLVLVAILSNPNCFAQENEKSTFQSQLGTPKKNSGFKWKGYTIWGSSVIKGDDGKYHMFATRWLNGYPLSTWITDATIVHAVSDAPEGPFKFVAEALPPRGEGFWDGSSTYNPVIQKHKDTYILFYTGSYYANTGDLSKNRYNGVANKRIGIATSKSLNGPWKRYDKPIIEPRPGKWDAIITSNAAPYVEEDGSVLLVYKSWTRHSADYYANRKPGEVNQLLGVARADHYLGEYKRIKEERLFSNYPIAFNSEDPFIWKQGGKYHMLAKIFEAGEKIIGESDAGYYATSKDGINWTIDTSGKAYSRTINWTNGSTETFKRVERPQLLIQDGVPTHIYFACLSFYPEVDSRSICVPLKK